MSNGGANKDQQPKSFREVVERLGRIQSFDVGTLLGDDEVPQHLCDFIVALALASNDLRDLSVVVVFAQNERPGRHTAITRRRGETAGMESHIVRLYASFVDSLLKLIRDNPDAVGHPYLAAVLKQVPRATRDAWAALVEAANGRWEKSTLGNALVTARNKVGYHYDAEQIGRGYRQTFEDHAVAGAGDVPMLSRGDRAFRTRFYFADAAAQGYVAGRFGGDYLGFTGHLNSLIDALHEPLRAVVEAFLQKRGPFRDVKSDFEDVGA